MSAVWLTGYQPDPMRAAHDEPGRRVLEPVIPVGVLMATSLRSRTGTAPATVAGVAKAQTLLNLAQGRGKSFRDIYMLDPLARVFMIKSGLTAKFIDEMAGEMHKPREWLLATVGVSSSTFKRKKQESKPLSKDDSERVLGMARLVGQVQTMVEQSGDPGAFDAAEWVGRWLDNPVPALGGRRPTELMDTVEGQTIVSNLLARIQSGAYA